MRREFTAFWDMQAFIDDSCKKKFHIARPLTHLLHKDAPFIFTKECLQVFRTLNKALISTHVIQPPNRQLPFEIMCDVSDYIVGEVLRPVKGQEALCHILCEQDFDWAPT
jgi:hypothetical protein